MRKHLFLGYVFLICGMSAALNLHAARNLPDDLEYISPIQAGQSLTTAQQDDVNDFHKFFINSSFVPMNQSFGSGQEFLGVDQIFYRQKDARAAYVMFNVVPKNKSQIGRLYSMDEKFVYHGLTANGVGYAVLFENFDEKTLEPVVELFDEQRGEVSFMQSSKDSLVAMLAPQNAHAGVPTHAPERSSGAKRRGLGESKATIAYRTSGGAKEMLLDEDRPSKSPPPIEQIEDSFLRSATNYIGRCSGDAVYGAVDRTLGAGYRILRTICRTFVKPKQVWNNAVASFNKIWGTFRDLRNDGVIQFSRSKLNAWWQKDPEEKRRAICEFLGGLSAQVALANYLPKTQIGRTLKSAANHLGKKMPNVSWTDDARRFIQGATGYVRVADPMRYALRMGALHTGFAAAANSSRSMSDEDNGKCIGSF